MIARVGGPGPGRPDRRPAARLGAAARQAAARPDPPVHRGPAPDGDRGRSQPVSSAGCPGRTCCCWPRSCTTSARATATTTPITRWPARRSRSAGCSGWASPADGHRGDLQADPAPPAARRHGRPARPRRPGDHRRRSSTPSVTYRPSSCCTRCPRRTRGRPARTPGPPGGPGRSVTWSPGYGARWPARQPAQPPADHRGGAANSIENGGVGIVIEQIPGALRVTIAAPDRPGLLAAAAARADPAPADGPDRRPSAPSTAPALQTWTVAPQFGDAPAAATLRADLIRALDGSLDVGARLAKRVDAGPPRPGRPARGAGGRRRVGHLRGAGGPRARHARIAVLGGLRADHSGHQRRLRTGAHHGRRRRRRVLRPGRGRVRSCPRPGPGRSRRR